MSEERRRLARELHDTLAHSLSAVAVQLEGVRSLWSEDPARAEQMLDRSLEAARSGLTEARRSIHALRASPLEAGGLRLALGAYVDDLAAGSDLQIELDADDPGRFDPNLEHNVFRIATEAVTNAVRHANADRIRVWMRGSGDQLSLAVQDNGAGFDPATANGGHGLGGMRERAELIGGTLQIESTPQRGSTVLLRVTAP
jgi:signal transduction histidine kinase